MNYWSINLLNSLKNLKKTHILNKKKIPTTLRYYYYIKKEEYMEQEYSYKGVIDLDEKEKEVFELLQYIVNIKQINTTMRVAGGWVRDKVSLFLSLILSFFL